MNESDNPNGIHVFNRFEEKGFVERFQCHFRLVDIPRDTFYALAILEEWKEFFSEALAKSAGPY